MKHGKQPHCYVVAGPNGAGKTTFALKYLPRIVSCHDFINADEIAKGLSPLNYEAGLLRGSKIFLETLNRKITERNDFAFETTLSGRTYLPRIVEWRGSGWMVTLFYLYIYPRRRVFCSKSTSPGPGRRTRHPGGGYCQTVSAKHSEYV